MPIKVRALQDGFFKGSRIRAGVEFVLPDGVKPGKWMKVLADAPAPKKPEAPAPKAAPAAKAGKGKEDSELA